MEVVEGRFSVMLGFTAGVSSRTVNKVHQAQ
jgi:hypothetical protein